MQLWPVPLRLALTLLFGTGAGLGFFALGLPLPWMLGPMLLCAALAVAGVPLVAPAKLRPMLLPILGVTMGSRLTPEAIGQAGNWISTLALLPFFLIVAASGGYLIYRYIAKLDPATSYYAAMPGGLQEMILLGTAAGGDERQLALSHAVRIMLTVFMVAISYALIFDVTSSQGNSTWIGFADLSVQDYLILAACALGGRAFGQAIKMPAGNMFAPMIFSGIAHIAGWVSLPPPSLLVTACLIVLGTVTGSRFLGMAPRAVAKAFGPSALVAVFLMGVSFAFAVLAAQITGMTIGQTFLAFAAGGVTEMGLLTFALGFDVAFVSLLHLLRIMLIVLVAQPSYLRLKGKLK